MKEAKQSTNPLAKASAIVSKVKPSTHAKDILDGEKELQTANTTRWNSKTKMVRSILDCPEESWLKQLTKDCN